MSSVTGFIRDDNTYICVVPVMETNKILHNDIISTKIFLPKIDAIYKEKVR
jgi:hypothetical protein